jgi:3-isopropylmalate/(R)-2-methylmalate dehydratase small subunit
MDFMLKGKCWKFGDNLGSDSAILSIQVQKKTHDPKVLKDFVLTQIDPDFPKRVHAGDIIVAGKNFGNGNPHVWGYHGIRELGIGIIAEFMARGAIRNAVTAGVLFLPEVENITRKVNQGDELEVNFKTGEIRNLSNGEIIKAKPLPAELLEIIEAGGEEQFLRKKFARA